MRFCPWYHRFIFMVLGFIHAFLDALGSLLWLHAFLVELQVDALSEEHEGFISEVFKESVIVQ